MKISEITVQDLEFYGKEDATDVDTIKLFNTILSSAKAYIKSQTGLDDAGMDAKEDLTVALMVLCNEMYENRQYTVQNDKVNVVIKSIIDSHCINLL